MDIEPKLRKVSGYKHLPELREIMKRVLVGVESGESGVTVMQGISTKKGIDSAGWSHNNIPYGYPLLHYLYRWQ